MLLGVHFDKIKTSALYIFLCPVKVYQMIYLITYNPSEELISREKKHKTRLTRWLSQQWHLLPSLETLSLVPRALMVERTSSHKLSSHPHIGTVACISKSIDK